MLMRSLQRPGLIKLGRDTHVILLGSEVQECKPLIGLVHVDIDIVILGLSSREHAVTKLGSFCGDN